MKGLMVKRLAENKVTANKMAEEKQKTTRGPKEVTAKDLKKVEQGKQAARG